MLIRYFELIKLQRRYLKDMEAYRVLYIYVGLLEGEMKKYIGTHKKLEKLM